MRYLFFIFLYFSSLDASSLFHKAIESYHISEDFKNYKSLNIDEYRVKKLKQFSIKIKLNKDFLSKKNYYMYVVSDFDSLINTNAVYTKHNHLMIINLKQNSDVLYFDYKYDSSKRGEFRCDIINEFEYKFLLPYEGILYGIAYGIIFCAFLYYIIIYFSTLIKAFLYYSIMQFFVLLSLIGFVYFSFLSYPNQNYLYAQAWVDIFETLGLLFTLFFVKEILKTKTIMPKINIFLNFFIFLNLADILAISIFKYSILYEYMPFYFGFFLPMIAGIIAVIKGNKYAIIYTLGWGFLCIVVYLLQKLYFNISGIYIIHLAASFESLIFSFALGLMLKDLVNKQNEKEKLLIHKSKLVSMGEMINNIAHQWRQPLTHLSFINMNLELESQDDNFDKSYLLKKIKESNEQIEFMSSTIDSFRNFYKPQKEKEFFWISNSVNNVISMMKPLLELHKIDIELNIINNKQIKAYENEYAQVVLNLITNAKDALIIRKIKNPKIIIDIDFKNRKTLTSVSDNAKGIDLKIIDKIFEPYFSTKDNGSGIGLYMCRLILKSHFKGDLIVENKKDGASFTIEV